MKLAAVVQKILTSPNPTLLWELYGELMESGEAVDRSLLKTIEVFHHYLCDLQSKATARQFSEIASMLDIGAVGGVAVENLLDSKPESLFKRFLLGAASESLMVLASRQYIKGWQSELHSVHCQAAWYLAGELWHLSQKMESAPDNDGRWAKIQSLFEPVRDSEFPNPSKATLLCRVFQVVILIRVLPLLNLNRSLDDQ